MTLKDIWKTDPLSEEFLFGKPKKDKSKKKKKKKKEKKLKKQNSLNRAVMELESMSKSELRDRMIQLGVDSTNVDTDSKKSMRQAIRKALDPSYVEPKPVEVDDSDSKSEKALAVKFEGTPPHYYDEKTGDFIIKDAMDAPDMTCYEAMESLGALRRTKRVDDGFGMMMDKLSRKIVQEANRLKAAEEPAAIEAEFTVEDV